MRRVDPGRGRDQRRFRSARRMPGRRHNPPVAMPLQHGELARFHPGGHPLACARRCGGGTLVAAVHGSRPVPLRSSAQQRDLASGDVTALMAAGLLIAAVMRTGSRRRQRTVMPCNARPGCVGCRRHSQSAGGLLCRARPGGSFWRRLRAHDGQAASPFRIHRPWQPLCKVTGRLAAIDGAGFEPFRQPHADVEIIELQRHEDRIEHRSQLGPDQAIGPETQFSGNFCTSKSPLGPVIPDSGLFRNRLQNQRLPQVRVQNSGKITNCLLPLARSPAYAK